MEKPNDDQATPGVGNPFPVFVPQVDENGNDLGGVRHPELGVPLATCTGWNLRDPKTGMPGERVSFIGSFLPFPKTKPDATATGDPRSAISERYSSREDYQKNSGMPPMNSPPTVFSCRETSTRWSKRGVEDGIGS